MKKLAALALIATLPLAGCSSGSDPEPTTTESAVADTDTAVDTEDVTQEVQDAAGDLADVITSASITSGEGPTVTVETTIVDPRDDGGSQEAQDAIAICNAALEVTEPRMIRVNEADGTAFAAYLPDAMGEFPAHECIEY